MIIRSFEDFPERLQNFGADIICIQETKVSKHWWLLIWLFNRFSDQLTRAMLPSFPASPPISPSPAWGQDIGGWPPSAGCPWRQPRQRPAWPGLGTLVPSGPWRAVWGRSCGVWTRWAGVWWPLTRHRLGDIRHLVIINVYCPQADPEKLDRVRYKQMFNKTLDIWANRGCGGLGGGVRC